MFILTALIFVPAGLFFYFLSPEVASSLGVMPLWLARVAGGLILAWGVWQLFSSGMPTRLGGSGLVLGNLLTIATLGPALLKQGHLMPPAIKTALTVICFLLAISALGTIWLMLRQVEPRSKTT